MCAFIQESAVLETFKLLGFLDSLDEEAVLNTLLKSNSNSSVNRFLSVSGRMLSVNFHGAAFILLYCQKPV